jgi:GPN-loop GTPase
MSELPSKPTVILVIGMAGSGKTTLIQRLNSKCHEKAIPDYLINLDPAVKFIPYEANIDIRDTVNYKNIIKQFNLGPNGAILTASNLFATRFDHVLNLCKKRSGELRYIFIDTPGQIEMFTWSASGTIISKGFSDSFPTVIIFVIDALKAGDPSVLVSNLIQAVSIFYKIRIRLIVVLNKIDVAYPDRIKSWLKDFDSFQKAMEESSSFSSDLSRSLSICLEEFCQNLTTVYTSALSGEGLGDLFEAIDASVN